MSAPSSNKPPPNASPSENANPAVLTLRTPGCILALKPRWQSCDIVANSSFIIRNCHTGSVFCVDMVGWLILRGFVGERLILKGFVVVVVLGFTIVNVC